jgi:hypothetical protein
MATRRKEELPNGQGKARIKFRYTDEDRTVQFSVEGATGELVTEMRSLTNALAGRVLAAQPTRLIKNAGSGTTSMEEEEEQALGQGDAPESEGDETPDTDSGDVTESNNTERKRRIPPEPKVLNDLDITAGPMPLKQFVAEKGPRKSQDRLVVVAVWLKKYKNYEEVGRDHLYSCYQQMGGSGDWKSVNDWDTYFRTLGKRKGWFEKGKNEASFKVTIIASNYVDGLKPDGK